MKAFVQKHAWWILGALVALGALYWLAGNAQAADLGGNCCADLEERIAELEATTARKGTRKVSVTIYGRLSKAVVWSDGLDDSLDGYSVGDNSNAPSYLGVGGAAQIGGSFKAGFKLELGVGGYDLNIVPPSYGHLGGGSTDRIYIQKAYVYLSGDVGMVAVGTISQASDGVSAIDVSNSSYASTPLSLRPLVGPGIGEVLDVFDGSRVDGVWVSSPVFKGFQVSATAARANFGPAGTSDDLIWDAALRYAGEFGQFKVAAGVAYRDGLAVQGQSIGGLFDIGDTNLTDVKVWSGSASVMHMPSGLFVNASAGKLDAGAYTAALDDITGYAGKLGVEQSWTSLGASTIFVEYGKWDLGNLTTSEISYWGGGVVQSLDAASMKLYLSGRAYDTDGILSDDPTVVMGGATLEF